MKATAIAPANVAFVKYWGKKDEVLRLPENGSISMNLSSLLTTTTVEFSPNFKNDRVVIDDKTDGQESQRVINHLDLIRKSAPINYKAKVVSVNNFPPSSGLASSASGFAALTLAASKALDLNLSEKQLSILARQGSGSACRSIPDGFVQWHEGYSNKTSYAESIFPEDYWDIADVVVVANSVEKKFSSTEGQRIAKTSPFIKTRLSRMKGKIKILRELIKQKDFDRFGELIENEALELHAVIMTTAPPIIYWSSETIEMMKLVGDWRNKGLPVFFTIDAGPHVHLIVEKKDIHSLLAKLKKTTDKKNIIINYPAKGARLTNVHLF